MSNKKNATETTIETDGEAEELAAAQARIAAKKAGSAPVIKSVASKAMIPDSPKPRSSSKKVKRETAESMATRQKEISVAEFFAKNRHLLGFDNPRKALLTSVKEAVDNSLDAC